MVEMKRLNKFVDVMKRKNEFVGEIMRICGLLPKIEI